jgi:hypothetical protein
VAALGVGESGVPAGGPADQRLAPRRWVGQRCGGDRERRERLAVVQDVDAGVEGGAGGNTEVGFSGHQEGWLRIFITTRSANSIGV